MYYVTSKKSHILKGYILLIYNLFLYKRPPTILKSFSLDFIADVMCCPVNTKQCLMSQHLAKLYAIATAIIIMILSC